MYVDKCVPCTNVWALEVELGWDPAFIVCQHSARGAVSSKRESFL